MALMNRQGEARDTVFIDDSDILFAVSLAPLGKDAAWHMEYRLATPLVNTQGVAVPGPQTVYVDHGVPLDPVTVDFLEESELLLRNVMKIRPTDVDDLADAKQVAGGQLVDIAQRKEAAADVPPVVDAIETYETILRDLRNLDERSAAEDIADIQSRIQKNGLIANMKAFQPSVTTVTPVSFDFR